MQNNSTKKKQLRYALYTDEEKEAVHAKVVSKILSSKANAVAFLKSVGILDKKGELAEPYR
jgi:hypothetical protein